MSIRNRLKVLSGRLPFWLSAPARRAYLAIERLFTAGRFTSAAGGNGKAPSYHTRMASELATFETQVNVHDLPEIFHYWSNRYLRPMMESFGFSHPDAFFEQQLGEAYDRTLRSEQEPARFVSIGSGNCDTEVPIAEALVKSGRRHFTLECLDINPDMLSRGTDLAVRSGVSAQIRPRVADFNAWSPDGCYDAVLANQSLHHVVELEALFDAVRHAIGDHGRFITSDMIGRNGHARWPEALAMVQEFWRELPKSYRYNVMLRRHEEAFGNWDCSVEGFEGIRAQDILPLLVERFGFSLFLAYGNLIDPFTDRAFGHNYDASAEWDRSFIDRVHARDEEELLAGRIKPTHMLAAMVADRSVVPRVRKHMTPTFCVRPPG